MSQQSLAALRERVKELTCLYGIARVAERRDLSLAEILQAIVDLLPSAWQHPKIASARIRLDSRDYVTPNFREGTQKQVAEILVKGAIRGSVEVTYLEELPACEEGPFLKWERNLIDAVAREVALIAESRQVVEERAKIQEQLRHADRLVTIGQLAAGVAHELNEPLGNILGFAQLAKKCSGLPGQAAQDLGKIVDAALFARDVIRKLLIFARQSSTPKLRTNLSEVVEQGLSLLESRCNKEGIELRREIGPDIPELVADPSQLNQVLVNLVVNAIQAMPRGGVLTIRTRSDEDHAVLIVEDTGIGMSEDVAKRIFDPFFTTKDVDAGTGLGLAVVHGIVTSHGGSIDVTSEVGAGARFEIRLPLRPPELEEGNTPDGLDV